MTTRFRKLALAVTLGVCAVCPEFEPPAAEAQTTMEWVVGTVRTTKQPPHQANWVTIERVTDGKAFHVLDGSRKAHELVAHDGALIRAGGKMSEAAATLVLHSFVRVKHAPQDRAP